MKGFFLKKNPKNQQLTIWKLHEEKKHFKMFPQTFNVDPQGDLTPELILNHLMTLENNMTQFSLHNCPQVRLGA